MEKNTVFIVDDNKVAGELLEWLLSVRSISAKTFLFAEDFLNICHADMNGCLILDMHLPQMDGIALLQELRRRNIRLPVIIVSGQIYIPTTIHSTYESIVAVFKKPANTDELIATIQQALENCES